MMWCGALMLSVKPEPIRNAHSPGYPRRRPGCVRRIISIGVTTLLLGCGASAPQTNVATATEASDAASTNDSPHHASERGRNGPRAATGPEDFRISGVQAPMTRAAFEAAISERLPQVARCYETELDVDPSLQGRVLVDFVCRGPRCGQTTVVSNEMENPRMDRCIELVLGGLIVEGDESVGERIVRYPFAFRPVTEDDEDIPSISSNPSTPSTP